MRDQRATYVHADVYNIYKCAAMLFALVVHNEKATFRNVIKQKSQAVAAAIIIVICGAGGAGGRTVKSNTHNSKILASDFALAVVARSLTLSSNRGCLLHETARTAA